MHFGLLSRRSQVRSLPAVPAYVARRRSPDRVVGRNLSGTLPRQLLEQRRLLALVQVRVPLRRLHAGLIEHLSDLGKRGTARDQRAGGGMPQIVQMHVTQPERPPR